MGVIGIALAMGMDWCIKSLLDSTRWRSEKWKKVKVIWTIEIIKCRNDGRSGNDPDRIFSRIKIEKADKNEEKKEINPKALIGIINICVYVNII